MIRYIRKYSGFTRCAIENKLAYKGAFLLGWAGDFVGILISVFLWKMLFAQYQTIQGYDWNQMVLYLLLVAMMNATLSIFAESNMASKILDGSVASDLTKPIDFQHMTLFTTIGYTAVEAVISLALVSILAFGLTDLSSYLYPMRISLFFLSLILAFMIKFCLAYMGGLMCFFTSNGYGVIYLRQILTDVFSGALLPLSFFPAWFQNLAGFLPFQAVVHLPIQIFLGNVQGEELYHALLLQVFWIVVMWIAAKKLFDFAVRKITVHGG